MKKILFTLFSVLILSSCQSNEIEDSQNPPANVSLKENSSKITKATFFAGAVNKNVQCGGSSFTNPININPNYPYISDNVVAFWDNSPLLQAPDIDRSHIDLSHFVINNLLDWGSAASPNPIPIYYGYSSETNFSMYQPNLQTISFTIGQDGDNAAIYGDITNSGPNGYMTNDAANTVLHGFKSMLASSNLGMMNIKAIHIKTDGLLCIPSVNFIKLTIKY